MGWFTTAIRRVLSGAWRHRWTFAVPIVTLLVPTVIYAVRLPDVYEAKAVVEVQDFNSGDSGAALPGRVDARADQIVLNARSRLLGKAPLQSIVPLIEPGARLDDPKVIEDVRKRISYDRLTDLSFQVSITDEDPELAAKVVNTLVESFQELERAGPVRELEAKAKFHKEQADEADVDYRRALAELDAYRVKHAETLPEAKDAINSRMNAVSTEMALQKNNAQNLRSRISRLAEQISRGQAGRLSIPVSRPQTSEEKRLETQLGLDQSALADARRRLGDARRRYGSAHKVVRGLEQEFLELQAAANKTATALSQVRADEERAWRDQQSERAAGPVRELQRQHELAQKQLGDTETQIKEYIVERQGLTAQLAKIPETRAGLQKLEAVLIPIEKTRKSRMEASQRAAQKLAFFKESQASDVTPYNVAQWAVAPPEPTGPKRMSFLLTAIALGAGIGYGLLLLRRKFEVPTLTSVDQVTRLVPGAMVVAVPMLGESGAVAPPRIHWVRDSVLWLYVLAGIAVTAMAVLAYKGVIEAPTWLAGLISGTGGLA